MHRIPHQLIALSLLGLAATAPAHAQVNAPVVQVQPIYATADQGSRMTRCTYASPSQSKQQVARILGGLAGGYAGNQMGGGSGRDLATIAGAIAGAEFAASHSGRPSRRCGPAHEIEASERDAIEGYDVIYRHAGRLWRTRRSEHPGDTVVVPDRREFQ